VRLTYAVNWEAPHSSASAHRALGYHLQKNVSHELGQRSRIQMTTPVRQLHMVQVACILFALLCVVVSGFVRHESPGNNVPLYWLVVALATYCAISGFTVQRFLSRPARSQQSRRRSTPFSRWRAGHLARLFSALSVAPWALVLSNIGGPPWAVDALFVLGLLLLLRWTPGASPVPGQPEPSNR
jgi:hypothetical protein